MTLNEINRKPGRPRSDEKITQIKFKLPEKGRTLHIEQTKKEGNKKKLTWEGTIIDESSSCFLIKLASGIKENFVKNDFKFGILTYQYVHKEEAV